MICIEYPLLSSGLTFYASGSHNRMKLIWRVFSVPAEHKHGELVALCLNFTYSANVIRINLNFDKRVLLFSHLYPREFDEGIGHANKGRLTVGDIQEGLPEALLVPQGVVAVVGQHCC